MFHVLEKRLQEAFLACLERTWNITDAPVSVEQPREESFGEIALPIAFQLARRLRMAPKLIAQRLVAEVGAVEGVARFEVAGNGYINVRVDRGYYGHRLLAGRAGTPAAPGKVIVEHTNINPNKAAHIGHLRNAILGDTFVRMLRATSREVEVQNYVDNTGVQVADVVVGFQHLDRKTPEEVRALTLRPKFDHLCWDLYARVSAHYRDHPEALGWRQQALHAIELGEGRTAEMAHIVADAIVLCHLRTMGRLGIGYDVLPRESEILHLRFWATAFELLKQRQAIYFEEHGKNAGCWVMPAAAFRDMADDEQSKVIVRSDGTVTYVGKDIAYQLWKFGLLGRDFHYRPLLQDASGRTVWVTCGEPGPAGAPAFGAASEVYNVIDSRQSYLQDVVAAGLRALGYHQQADRSIHFSYEMVALSTRAAVELGVELSDEDRKKGFVDVSGRKGLGEKADDLIDKLIEKALDEVNSRHPESTLEERREVAAMIAVGALRYFMLKFTRSSVIAFDFQEALSFEGETGPYVQYAAVRARNILRKFEEGGKPLPDFPGILGREAMARQLASEDFWQLLLAASKAETAITRAVAGGEPAHVAKYAFQLAQAFNTFYHDYPVIHERDSEKRDFLLWMTAYVRDQLERVLRVLGITVPPYM